MFKLLKNFIVIHIIMLRCMSPFRRLYRNKQRHITRLLRIHNVNKYYMSNINNQTAMRSISEDSKKQVTHLTFGEMVDHAKFVHHDPNVSLTTMAGDQFLIQSAEFARSESPYRVAKLIMCLKNLPYGVSETESMEGVINDYIITYQQLKEMSTVKNIEDVHKFSEFCKYLLLKHLLSIPKISYGLLQKATPNATFTVEQCPYLNDFIDEFAEQRISLRVLTGHMIALYGQLLEKEDNDIKNVSGLFEENCEIIKYVENAIIDAKADCYTNMEYFKEEFNQNTGDNIPNVEIYDFRKIRDNDLPFTYIPEHLHHMVFELIKNAMRAVMEFDNKTHKKHDIDVIIVNNESDGSISIKISDKGGGIKRDDLDKIWLYSYSTAYGLNNMSLTGKMTKQRELLGQVIESAEKEWQYKTIDVCDIKHNKSGHNKKIAAVDRSVLGAVKYTPMFGLGYGLPIVKVYAQYFGGSCQIQSIDGYGTDAYLYLNNLKRSNVRVI
eukprot:375021_1